MFHFYLRWPDKLPKLKAISSCQWYKRRYSRNSDNVFCPFPSRPRSIFYFDEEWVSYLQLTYQYEGLSNFLLISMSHGFGRRWCRNRVVVAPNGMTSDCEFLNFNVIILSSTSLYAGGTISFEDDSFGILTSKWWISPSNLVPRSLVDEAEGNEIISLDSDPRIASYACALVCATFITGMLKPEIEFLFCN